MAFAAAAAMGMELMEVIGGGAAVAEAAADVAAAVEAVAMEEGIPLMETAVGRTVTGAATRSFAAYSGAARAGSIARALGGSALLATGVQGAMAARSFKKAEQKLGKFLGLGKRKRDDDVGTSSLLPARPTHPTRPGLMPKVKGAKRSAKRATKKSSVKKSQKKATKRKASKKTTKKKGVSRQRLVRYETHGLIQRDHVSYFGFQNTGGRDELLRSGCEALLKAMLRKFRIQVRTPDETLQLAQSVPSVDKVIINFRQKDFNTGGDGGVVEDTFDLNGQSFILLVDAMLASFKSRVASGHFPYFMRAFNKDGTGTANEVMRDAKFGDAKLSLSSTVRIKLRNITPNDGNGTDRFALDTNPLQGVMYKFSGDVPLVKESIYEGVGRTQWAKFHDKEAMSGLCFGPQRASGGNHNGAPDAASDIMGNNRIMSSPPKNGKMVWQNCVSSTPLVMQPGVGVTHKMKFSFTGTLQTFLHKLHGHQYKLPKVGACHWIGLEQKYKQKTKAASGAEGSSEHDHVVVEYDLDTTISGGAAFAAAASAPRTVITRAAHNSV